MTSIGEGAFGKCTKLTSITIPKSLESIGSEVFKECNNLAEIIWNSTRKWDFEVEGEGKGIFRWKEETYHGIYIKSIAPQIERVVFGEGVTAIPNSFCYGMKNVTEIVLPSTLKSIGTWAFCDCSRLTTIAIPNSVTSIGSSAFSGCSSLSSIIIPEGVTKIPVGAFYKCSALQNVTMGNKVTHIGEEAFYQCRNLYSIQLSNSLEHIREEAFYGCVNLNTIDIPHSVKVIWKKAFFGCNSLTEIFIPKNVASIGDQAFAGCSHLVKATIESSSTRKGYDSFSYSANVVYKDAVKKPVGTQTNSSKTQTKSKDPIGGGDKQPLGK